jgi:hypothetical protein
MNIPRSLKVLLLGLTIWQPVYIVAFMAIVMMGTVGSLESLQTLMTVHMATMVASIGLLIFYIVHLFKAPSIPSDKRALWGIALFMGAPIAMPIYFFTHVWPEKQRDSFAIDHVIR